MKLLNKIGMGLRNAIIELQFKDATPNTVFGFDALGKPTYIGVFGGATGSVNGGFGMVPRPLIGQEGFFLRGDGQWAQPPSGGGGSGTVLGTGVANRLSFWSASDTINSDNTLTFDSTNKILKTSTINISRAGLPGGGIADGDFQYDSLTGDFRGRIGGQWINFTKQDEIIKDSTVTNYTIQESDRNSALVFMANSPVTVNLTALSPKFGVMVVMRGDGNITFTTGVTNTYLGTSNQILTKNAAAYLYHTSGNNWRGYGTLGSSGTGTVTRVTLLPVANFLNVTAPGTVNTAGDLQFSLANQVGGTFLRGPAVGAAPAPPTFGVITISDIPKMQFDQQTVADYTLREVEDYGRIVDIINPGAITIRIPGTLPPGWYCSVWRPPSSGAITFVSNNNTLEAEANILATPKTMAAVIVFPPAPSSSTNRHVVVGRLTA